MDKIKKVILFRIPMSICNFRCHYCYLAQRPVHYEGIQPKMKYSPEEVAEAMSVKRIGGKAYFNFCADGETLLTKDIDLYVRKILEQGHYVEFVTNLTITPVLDKFLSWPKDLLKRLEFKCSFHYQELKKRNLLDTFAKNVNKVWEAGASANIEITPSDELIPLIPEVKEYSMKNFGALPHLSIARRDDTENIDYLTKLTDEEYEKVWSQFDSSFWQFKRTIFGKKQTGFCHAGAWSYYIDLTTGEATQCYCGKHLGNLFEHPEQPLPDKAIGKCTIPHCYNGHMLLTSGLIPPLYSTTYGNIRDRIKQDGSHWLQPELLSFFNTQLQESNKPYSTIRRAGVKAERYLNLPARAYRKLKRIING